MCSELCLQQDSTSWTLSFMPLLLTSSGKLGLSWLSCGPVFLLLLPFFLQPLLFRAHLTLRFCVSGPARGHGLSLLFHAPLNLNGPRIRNPPRCFVGICWDNPLLSITSPQGSGSSLGEGILSLLPFFPLWDPFSSYRPWEIKNLTRNKCRVSVHWMRAWMNEWMS